MKRQFQIDAILFIFYHTRWLLILKTIFLNAANRNASLCDRFPSNQELIDERFDLNSSDENQVLRDENKLKKTQRDLNAEDFMPLTRRLENINLNNSI